MTRAVLIVNPRASGVTSERTAAVAAALRRGCELSVRETEGRGHATELAAAAAQESEAIIVFSGDGTYNEAINGADGLLPFGFVPGGGTSVFPRALGLPRDPEQAALRILDALEQGRSRVISLGRINGRRFCSSAGIGFDADVVRRVDRLGRDGDGRRAGTTAFIASTLRALRDARFRIPAQLEISDYGRAAMVVALNGSPYTYAGRLPVALAAGADFAVGLDLVALREVTPWRVLPVVYGVVRGTLDGHARGLSGHDLEAFSVSCDRPLPAQADGEDLGDLSEVTFEAERNALSVLC